ncbi:MAG: class I SAM-dependent rRNA methyltransferase [Chloroflexota bacterium]|nr:MAG: class I SAM-dependent rRNA methyltransferase [Chloroflexota bacterium]
MDLPAASLILKKGRDKPIKNRHPWIFSGAINRVVGSIAEPGQLVDILKDDGSWLARGYYNPYSQISARILTWQAEEEIDRQFWSDRIAQALDLRGLLNLEPETTAYRLINAEADGLPGLIVDKYGDYLVIQCLTAGIDRRKEQLAELLVELLQPIGIVERSDASVRKKEGLRKASGILYGAAPSSQLVIFENGLQMHADLYQGHKTGLYLDQRDNRAIIGHPDHMAGRDILNVFAYTGAFAIYGARAGASAITNIESSASLLEIAQANMKLNKQTRPRDEYLTGDAFQILRQLRKENSSYDAAILDPPKFARSQKDVTAASRGYKDLNMQALHLLRPGGLLATFSCSGLISLDLFQKLLFAAAVDSGRDVQIIRYMSQAADHPISVTYPESAYLKGFLCRVM